MLNKLPGCLLAASCAFTAPAALVLAAFPASDAVAQTASAPATLVNGQSTAALSGSSQSAYYYTFTVPAGATRASFAIAGSGDADLYVRHNQVPTTSNWDYRPYKSSSNESVSLTNPRSGTWYVMVRGYSSFSGVRLTATHNGASTTAAASAPTFSPAPGTYSGQVNVALSTSTPNGVIRFTTNGSTPTQASEVYNAPIMVTANTDVKAVTFAEGVSQSAVATGTYRINAPLQQLTNGVAVGNLSGATSSVSNFRFAVPSGVASVTFSLSGGSGDADMYVKYGQLATTSTWDQRPYKSGNNESVTIPTPRAGDYYVMVHGYRAYSGATIKAQWGGAATAGKPDLMAWGPGANPRITTETFSANSCDVDEGTITPGTKRLLRFSTQSRNLGTADLVLGNPANNPAFEWGSCHGHYHFRSFAQYKLLDRNGAVVRNGHKMGFCLMDISRVNSNANPSARYNCSSQGIQAGWADVYSSSLSGQWIDITGVPAGQYVLEITMDPMNVIDELDETNNVTRIDVSIN